MTIILSESCSSCSVTYVQRVTKVLRVLNLPGRRLNPIVASIPAITRPYIQAVWAHGCSLLTADRVFGRGVNLFEVGRVRQRVFDMHSAAHHLGLG
jgi:hypothetical protein